MPAGICSPRRRLGRPLRHRPRVRLRSCPERSGFNGYRGSGSLAHGEGAPRRGKGQSKVDPQAGIGFPNLGSAFVLAGLSRRSSWSEDGHGLLGVKPFRMIGTRETTFAAGENLAPFCGCPDLRSSAEAPDCCAQPPRSLRTLRDTFRKVAAGPAGQPYLGPAQPPDTAWITCSRSPGWRGMVRSARVATFSSLKKISTWRRTRMASS